MQNPSPEAIQTEVVTAIAQALDLDAGEVGLDDSLEHDLGAESLDFLDLAFLLERAFAIRMPRMNLLQRAEERLGAGTLVADGAVTAAGRDLLRRSMPEVDPARLVDGLRATQVGGLLTPRTFVRVVEQLLAAKREALATPCPACGGALEAAPTAPTLTCAACGADRPLPAGDDVLLAAAMGEEPGAG